MKLQVTGDGKYCDIFENIGYFDIFDIHQILKLTLFCCRTAIVWDPKLDILDANISLHASTISTVTERGIFGWLSILCWMRNAEFRPRIICGISDTEKTLWIQYTLCSVTKVVVCYLLKKRVATFTILPYCQQIAEHSAPVIPQSIRALRGQITHSIFRSPQNILTLFGLLCNCDTKMSSIINCSFHMNFVWTR